MRREEYHAYAFMSCFKSCCLWYFLGFTNSCSLCSTKWGRTFRIEVHVASVCRISCDSEYTALLMYAHVLTALVHAVPSRRCQGAPACRLHPELRSPSPTASRMLHVPRPIVLSLSRMPYSSLETVTSHTCSDSLLPSCGACASEAYVIGCSGCCSQFNFGHRLPANASFALALKLCSSPSHSSAFTASLQPVRRLVDSPPVQLSTTLTPSELTFSRAVAAGPRRLWDPNPNQCRHPTPSSRRLQHGPSTVHLAIDGSCGGWHRFPSAQNG